MLKGTQSQIEWAALIKPKVVEEFRRFSAALGKAAEKQAPEDRKETLAILDIVAEMRETTLANPSAGYFVRNWRELGDQIRSMLGGDARFRTIRDSRERRTRAAQPALVPERKRVR